jgi:O-methyltransferase
MSAKDWLSPSFLRAGASRRVAHADRVARLLKAEYEGITGDLAYNPSDLWRDEFRELKSFMRRVFQLLAYNGIEGDYAEFGCFGGTTFTLAWGAAALTDHPAHLWGFDSFAGLPAGDDPRDEHPGWYEGAMAMSEKHFIELCLERGMPRDRFTTVPGFYGDSLAPDATGPRPSWVSFAYVDCDLYTSTADVLRFLGSRIRHGTVLAFDDYFLYGESSPSGERIAAAEFFDRHDEWQLLPYLQWGWYGMSFIVERRGAELTASR